MRTDPIRNTQTLVDKQTGRILPAIEELLRTSRFAVIDLLAGLAAQRLLLCDSLRHRLPELDMTTVTLEGEPTALAGRRVAALWQPPAQAIETMPLSVEAMETFFAAADQAGVTACAIVRCLPLPHQPLFSGDVPCRRQELDLRLKPAASLRFLLGTTEMAVNLADDRIPVAPDEAPRRLRLAAAAVKDAETTRPEGDRYRFAIVHSVIHRLPWLLHLAGETERAVEAYRTALATAVQSSDPVYQMEAIASPLRFLAGQGRAHEAEPYVRELFNVTLPRESGEPVPGWLAFLDMNLHLIQVGRADDTRAFAQVGLEVTRAAPDRALEAHMHGMLGTVALYQNRLEEAETWLKQSLALHREFSHAQAFVAALVDLGTIVYQHGDRAEARRLMEDGEEFANHLNDLKLRGLVLHQLGVMEVEHGNPEHARALFEEALALAEQTDDVDGMASTGYELGHLAYQRGEIATARRSFTRSVAAARDHGFFEDAANLLYRIGQLEADHEQIAEALAAFEACVHLARQNESSEILLNATMAIMILSARTGDIARIAALLPEAERMARAADHSQYQADLREMRRLLVRGGLLPRGTRRGRQARGGGSYHRGQ